MKRPQQLVLGLGESEAQLGEGKEGRLGPEVVVGAGKIREPASVKRPIRCNRGNLVSMRSLFFSLLRLIASRECIRDAVRRGGSSTRLLRTPVSPPPSIFDKYERNLSVVRAIALASRGPPPDVGFPGEVPSS